MAYKSLLPNVPSNSSIGPSSLYTAIDADAAAVANVTNGFALITTLRATTAPFSLPTLPATATILPIAIALTNVVAATAAVSKLLAITIIDFEIAENTGLALLAKANTLLFKTVNACPSVGEVLANCSSTSLALFNNALTI